MEAKARYEVLDGLRGVAAIGVVFFHLSIIGLPIAHHGYLAVDFFFVLSGFVMSHAYANRLLSMGFRKFFLLRLIRIMPLSIIGLLFGSVYFLVRYFFLNQSFYTTSDIVLGTIFNVFLIPKPWMTLAPTDTIFPSNTPLWSPSLEMLLNVIWALLLFNAKSIILLVLICISGLALLLFTVYHGTADIGATWPTYLGGLSRAVFGFFTGVVLWRYRLKPNKSGPYPELSALVLMIILLSPTLGSLFDIVAIIIVFPLLILIASCSDYRYERPLFKLLGGLSYPLYVIHVPILMFTVGLTKSLKLNHQIYLVAIVAVLICIAVSIALDKIYDQPVRRILTKVLVP